MVRFTMKDIRKSSTMRLELESCDAFSEVGNIASEFWGEKDFLMRKGYWLMKQDGTVGDKVREGDMIELIPDPSAFRF